MRSPGDRYDTHDDDGQRIGDGWHWVRTGGPTAACTRQESARRWAALLAKLTRLASSAL